MPTLSRPALAPKPAPVPVRPPIRPPTVVIPPAPVAGLKRVLSVGINYTGSPYELYGCINDVTNLQTQLRQYFPRCSEMRLITDTTAMKPTRQNILDSFAWLTAGLKAGEHVLFHYAGHGGQVRDTNGDEVTGMDSCIYPVNAGRMETITDDEIRAMLAARVPAGCKCFVILDSCHSGSAVDLRYTWETPSQTSLTYTEDQRYAKTDGQILFLSGCRDSQVAADTVDKNGRPCGAMTNALLDTWRRYGPAIKLKYLLWDVRAFLKTNGYGQVPMMTTGTFMDMNGVFDLGSA